MPFVTAQEPQGSRAMIDKIFGAFNVVPGAGLADYPWEVGLFIAAPLPLTPDMVEAQFTVPTFGGYAAVDVTPSTPFELPNGNGNGISGQAMFICNSGAFADTILGYFVMDSTGEVLLAEYFDTPIPIAATGDFVGLTFVFPIPWLYPVS